MKRRGSRYVLGESIKGGYKYTDFAHGAGGVIWWQDGKGKMHEKFSKGGIGDLHYKFMGDNLDDWWRGRATEKNGGIVTDIPPVNVYAKGDIDLPDELFNYLTRKYSPKNILVDTPYEGLKKVARRR